MNTKSFFYQLCVKPEKIVLSVLSVTFASLFQSCCSGCLLFWLRSYPLNLDRVMPV